MASRRAAAMRRHRWRWGRQGRSVRGLSGGVRGAIVAERFGRSEREVMLVIGM